MGNQTVKKELSGKVVEGLAFFARKIAADSLDTTCGSFIYQPEEPKDLAKRLAVMKGK